MKADIPIGAFAIPADAPWTLSVTIFGIIVAAYLAYRFNLRFKKRERRRELENAQKARRAEFIRFANLIKNNINANSAPENHVEWLNFFKDNAVNFLESYNSVSSELGWPEKMHVEAAIRIIAGLARMDNGEIYQNQNQLIDALNKIPDK